MASGLVPKTKRSFFGAVDNLLSPAAVGGFARGGNLAFFGSGSLPEFQESRRVWGMVFNRLEKI